MAVNAMGLPAGMASAAVQIIARRVALPPYDPDADLIEAEKPTLKPVVDLADSKVEIDARLYEFNFSERRYRLRRYPNKRKFLERAVEVESLVARLREGGFEADDYFSLGIDSLAVTAKSEIGGYLHNEYMPLMGGPFSKQLYLYDYLDMHRKAFEAWNHNPLAKQIVRITRTFVIGKGVTASCKSQRAQQVWDDFAEANDLYSRLHTWCDEIAIFGELMLWWKRNPFSNQFHVRSVDPSTVWEIVTEPDDIEQVYYYYQLYPTQYQMYTAPGVPYTRYIVRQIPADQMLHIRLNVTSGEKRGRSDLFPILGWLKRVKDFYTAEVIRAQAYAAFAWDDTVKGGPSDVRAHEEWLKTNPPQAGEVFIHNEAIARQFITGAGRGADLSAEGEALLNIVGVGAGVPKEYLGINTAGSRATALVATEPAAKFFEDRQYVVEWMLHQLARRLFAAAGIPPKERDIEFTFPSIATEDRTEKLKDIALAESMAWISHQTAATVAAKELLVTTYDYRQEMEEVAKELDENPEQVISVQFGMVKKITQPEVPALPPGVNGQGDMGPELATKVRALNNPLNPAGAQNLRRDLSRKETVRGGADPKVMAPLEGAITQTRTTTKTKHEILREIKPTNFRPGYRTEYGKKVEATIGKAQQVLRGVLGAAAGVLGGPNDPLTRSGLIEFQRQFQDTALDRLLPLASQAYAYGVEKAKTQTKRDRSTVERHTTALATWFQLSRDRVKTLTERVEDWWEEEEQEEEKPTVAAFLQRWESPIMAMGLGLWTLYQLGFREAVVGPALTEEDLEKPAWLANYIAVGDENTCDPCMVTAANSPYPVDAVPMPGEVCLGQDACRCEIELVPA